MAYSTGVRLKSSAVELFRGLESSFQNREQLEVALAKMFGSCTGDLGRSSNGTSNRSHDDDDDNIAVPSQSSSSQSYSDARPVPRTTLGAAPMRRESSHSSSRRRRNRSSSRTTSRRSPDSVSSDSSSQRGGANAGRERRQSRADYGEHIYAQLFMDDQRRAAQAVHSLRETAAVQRAPPAAVVTPVSSSAVPSQQHPQQRPFPVSSPTRAASEPKIAPLSSNDVHVPVTPSFDDGISAISQHTLEAMEERVNRTRSTDSSLWSSLKESKTPPPLAPRTLPRVRSEQSKASTKYSRTSRTTHTSDTSSFQNMWQKEEQRYWHTQVEQDSRKSRKSKNESVRVGSFVRLHD